MQSSLFLVLRRMRAPLLTVIVVYAVSISGLVLIPGMDARGHPVRMDFLHAFYFVSYTATTIGFGEIPYAFTPGQRLWVTFCIYMTVVAWSYAFVKLLGLFQDRWFLQAIAEQRFKHQVRRLAEPFYLITGYGESGSMLCRALDTLGRRFVVLDGDQQRVAELDAAEYRFDTPALAADAKTPDHLILAGVKHPCCMAVLALTGDDRANLAVAAAVRLLDPDRLVICRTQSPAVAAEMRSFGVVEIVNPYQKFGEYLSLAIQSPGSYQLMAWLTGMPGTTLGEQTEPPHGPWLIDGDRLFAGMVAGKLRDRGLEVQIIQASNPVASDAASIASGYVGKHSGFVEDDLADLLRRAGIERAGGLIAGSNDDTRNLSLVAAARSIHPRIFAVLRQNHRANRILFDTFESDITVFSPEIVVHECLARLTTPLLPQFLNIVKERDDAWADAAILKLRSNISRQVPTIWTADLTAMGAPALWDFMLHARTEIRMDHLLRDPAERNNRLRCVPLLLARAGDHLVMPEPEVLLRAGDRILFAGALDGREQQSLMLQNLNVLEYVCSGRNVPAAWLWRKLMLWRTRGGEQRAE